MPLARLTTGVPGLDEQLGGGLVPGTLTVVLGATGIGKTQIGLQFAHAGNAQEQRFGCILDMASRGDSQSHQHYAHSMFGWAIEAAAEAWPPSSTAAGG
jgi:KaiC/GvpD/RAD55 family RecA-like ATPase